MSLLSRTLYQYNGNNQFHVPFDYLSKGHVNVERAKVPLSFDWLDAATIQVTTPLTAGDEILVYRFTPRNVAQVNFRTLTSIREVDLDNALLQNLYLNQELRDILANAGDERYVGSLEAGVDLGTLLTSGLIRYRGSVNLATSGFPTAPDTGDYWKVTGSTHTDAGGVIHREGDHILYNGSSWDLIDNGASENVFPQEAVETALGVVSTNLYYRPGHVRRYGAVGDGVASDLAALSAASLVANKMKLPVCFDGGDFFVDGPIPMYSGAVWTGAGMFRQEVYWLDIVSVTNDGVDMVLQVNDPDDKATHRIMQGDPVKIINCANTVNNGLFSVKTVDPEASPKVIYLSNSAAVTETPPAGAQARIAVNEGGTIIRMQNLGDGAVHTGDRFIDEEGLRNVVMHNLGFIGPGINEVYGGGIRFRRLSNQPDGSSRAITGYDFQNVAIEHVPMDGIRFDQLIHSRLSHLQIKRCVGDGLLFQAGTVGGTTTSVTIEAPYIQNCRRGIAMYTSAYCTFNNPVIEGCPIGYFFDRGIGHSINAAASETIKMDNGGQSGGVTILAVDCQDISYNGAAIYYNTEETGWSKCAFMFVDPGRRVESLAATINGGHIHWSIGQKIPVIGTRWSSSDVGRLYIDASTDWGYVPESGTTGSQWIGNSYWDDSIQIKGVGITRDARFNERYRVTSIAKTTYTEGNAFQAARDPGPSDDSVAGFNAFSLSAAGWWKNTTLPSREGRWLCIDDTPGAARWVNTEATYEIEFEGRDYNPLSKLAEPVGAESYVIRAGRNFGCDVATDWVHRVLETESDGTGQLNAWLDVAEWMPSRYSVRLNYDPYTATSTRQYVVKGRVIEAYNLVDYLRCEVIVADLNGHVQGDTIVDASALGTDGGPVWLEFTDLGIRRVVYASFLKEDQLTGNLFLYFPVDQFVQIGDQVDVFNPRISTMDGLWTVNAAAFDTATNVDGIPCVKITANDRTLGFNITRSVDDAVYRIRRLATPVSSQVSIDGLDSVFIFDPDGAVSMEGGRSGEFTFPDGVTQVTVDVPAANNWHFRGHIENSFTHVRVASSTYNQVTFERDQSVGDEVCRYETRRKKSPGYEAIYDRN